MGTREPRYASPVRDFDTGQPGEPTIESSAVRRAAAGWRRPGGSDLPPPARAVVAVTAATLLAIAPTPSAAQGAAAPSPSASRLVEFLQVEASYTYDDNVTRGRIDEEILPDDIYGLNVRAGRSFPIGTNAQVTVTGLLNAEGFHAYTGLSHVSGGLQAELQYRTSAAFDAVTFSAFARGWLDNYVSPLRDGGRYALGVNARGALTDRLEVHGELAYSVRSAESAVWDLTDYSARLGVDYALGRRGTLYLTGEYRRGDTVSDGVSSIVNVSLAQVFVLDDAFPGDQLFAYRYDATTWIGTLGYNLPLGPRDSIDLSWRRVRTTPNERPAFDVQGSLRYIDNQYSIAYVRVF